MSDKETILQHLLNQGASRRAFLKFCAVTASTLALPTREAKVLAAVLEQTPRPTVIWLSSQECTGCSESLLRSFEPTVENLILDHLSLDYHNTLQAASGAAAEAAREQAMADAFGNYVLVVDGSITARDYGAWSMIGGRSTFDILKEATAGAGLIISVGTCAAFGGLPKAQPNPSQAAGVGDLMAQGELPQRPLVNISGCPPVPEVITGVIAYFLAFGALPELDELNRPKVYYGKTVHDCCIRLPHFEAGNFAMSFDDEGARQGYCLLLLGCRGPETFNSCSTVRWNQGTSYPMHSGHGCLGCSEPQFWDRVGGFYGGPLANPIAGDGSACEVPVPPPLS